MGDEVCLTGQYTMRTNCNMSLLAKLFTHMLLRRHVENNGGSGHVSVPGRMDQGCRMDEWLCAGTVRVARSLFCTAILTCCSCVRCGLGCLDGCLLLLCCYDLVNRMEQPCAVLQL